MEIKFKKSLKDYDYIIMFDLASKVSGVCIWSLEFSKPIWTKVLNVDGKEELPAAELYHEIDNLFKYLKESKYEISRCLVSKEAMPLQVRSSTIKTFVALSRSHAILDYYCASHEIDVYDYTGIYPISAKSYARLLLNLKKEDKIEKEQVRDLIYQSYPKMINLTLDESDAIFLARTLVDIKWNKDINEEIKIRQKHKKTLKMENAIEEVNKEIQRLESLKN